MCGDSTCGAESGSTCCATAGKTPKKLRKT